MWFFTSLFVLYLAATWYSLQQAASPAVPCQEGRPCLRPLVLVAPNETLSLQLWIRNASATDAGRSSVWLPVETCRLNFSLPPVNTLPKLLTNVTTTTAAKDHGNDDTTPNHEEIKNNCTLDIPAFARHRSADPRQVRPLDAKFVFYHHHRQPVATAHFQLTRIVEKKKGNAFWSTTQLGREQPRNLLADRPKLETNNSVDASTSNRNSPPSPPTPDESMKTMYIPYFKYFRAPIRLRFAAEERPYGSRRRRDGFMWQLWNRTTLAPHFYVDDLALPKGTQAELTPAPSSLPQEDEDGTSNHNQKKPPVTIQIKMSSLSPLVHSLNLQCIQGFQMAERLLGGDEVLDEVRYFLSDERLYRFALTQIISYLHLGLDYLAFRDEVRFYRGKSSFLGVSASSVVTRLACSVVIFLYLLDGGGTSWVILLSMLASCVIEAWKVWKLLQPKFRASYPFISIRELKTETEQKTAEYDRIAIKYLSMVLYPVVAVWSLYALKHYEYASWYSWLVSNLANAVYTFGFISLCPQLYVNYRLKSVAHLPWKVFLYKIFNTFVDDVFAFLIEMPWKHRIMTLRDDVVFLLFLIQVYMYRVDKSRSNEFGYSYQGDAEKIEQDGPSGAEGREEQATKQHADPLPPRTPTDGKMKEE